MSSSPKDFEDQSGVLRYGQSWGRLMHAVRGGTSWSGSERNRCLLNVAGKSFADASSLSGLDFDDDGRAMAVTDWNRDGKLDLWLRNRTAPRLRLMLNQAAEGNSLSVSLQGVDCNRDAIGAVVEMEVDGKPMIRSVKAGEMFLSQSSKWLHFGLGTLDEIEAATVYWPGGKKEEFRGLKAGGRFVLRQGAGSAMEVTGPEEVVIVNPGPAPMEKTLNVASIRLPVALPFPALVYRDAAMKPKKLAASGRPQLVIIWESSCPVCGRDLKILEKEQGKLAGAGIEVRALAADRLQDSAGAYDLIDDSRYTGAWGFCDPASLQVVWKWQSAWFDRRMSPSVPFGVLLDGRGYAVSLYRGGIEPETVLGDAKELVGIDPLTRWHLAPPFKGTWFTNPPDREFVLNSVRAKMRGE